MGFRFRRSVWDWLLKGRAAQRDERSARASSAQELSKLAQFDEANHLLLLLPVLGLGGPKLCIGEWFGQLGHF